MLTRILLLISAFACLPACKKESPPPPAPSAEQVSTAEDEITQIAKKIGSRKHDLEVNTDAARAIYYKTDLDDLQAELTAVREKNKDLISMEASDELARITIKEAKLRIEEIVAEIEAKSKARDLQQKKERQERLDRESEESRREMMNEMSKPFKLGE